MILLYPNFHQNTGQLLGKCRSSDKDNGAESYSNSLRPFPGGTVPRALQYSGLVEPSSRPIGILGGRPAKKSRENTAVEGVIFGRLVGQRENGSRKQEAGGQI
jgi:hypothetical protein